ncbi:MAG: TIGR03571 family LLM class oxidoreductase [Gammaproteobacteria bacterium]|nr:TIGR03571 family LLM class oxidoreductase [Gammaproteobacteria bacterium]
MSNRTFGPGFHSVFSENKLTLGTIFPIEAYSSPVPFMQSQMEMASVAERGGFAALWSRDVPVLDPSFGDAGQIYDPWVWLGYVAAHTSHIALGTGSIILPLRRPVDLAKAAASVDQLSQGRLILGVASGDRPIEYSIYDVPFEQRDEAFRQTFQFIRKTAHRPKNWDNQHAAYSGQIDLLPKSHCGDIPLFVTGNSRQSLDWIAEYSDGWLMYPRPVAQQQTVLNQWQSTLTEKQIGWKPFCQSLYIDLTDDPDTSPSPIHLGYRLGRNRLIEHLVGLDHIGVNHVTFNLRFSKRPVDDVLLELCEYVVPCFPALSPETNT